MATTIRFHARTMLMAGGLMLATALCCSLAGCKSAPIPAPRVLAKDVSGQMEQEFVSVSRGQTLSVRLRANTAEGYRWRMIPGSEHNNLLALDERHTEGAGANAWEIFTFRTRGTGNTTLEFLCDRPMETEPLPTDKRFTLNVQVNKPGATTAHAAAPTQ